MVKGKTMRGVVLLLVSVFCLAGMSYAIPPTWEADVRLTNDSSFSRSPAITSDANGLHVVWMDGRDGNPKIYYKHSPDFGNTWDADVMLTCDPRGSWYPAITSDANGLHVVWYDYRDGNFEIYYKHSPDFGNTWDADVRLTNAASDSLFPAITSDANGLHVVWEDDRDGNYEIYYKHSPDFGNTWDADVRLTNDSSGSVYPAITSDANGLHVVWYDYRDGNAEIYYKRSPDFGNTWGPDVRLTNAAGWSGEPVITSDANGLHVVWHDYRDGNYEIYYKRGTFLTIDIILNDDSFEPGQTITIDVQVDNPDLAITADVRICVKLPNGEYYRIIKLNDFPIPSGTLGPINLVNHTFTTNDLEGTYEAIGRLLHPDSGETLTEDIEPFEFANP
jgi:hypothetical protein